MQLQDDGEWRPVAYASRAMSATEQRYAQIEKEALGITWASERFEDYLIGLKFHIETDHRPLVPLLSTRNLEDLPARVQQFRMRMTRFTYSVSHVPGKALFTADTLSRAPLVRPLNQEEEKLETDVRAYKALMAYRATPLESGLSPAELLMGRKIRTRIPISPSNLNPSWPYLEQFRENDASLKGRQKRDFDRRHSAKTLPELLPGERIWIPD